jgi:hypothetical protein
MFNNSNINSRAHIPTPKLKIFEEEKITLHGESGSKRKDVGSGSKSKRISLQRVKKVNRPPLEKRDALTSKDPHKLSARSKQHSVAKTRLVYKKDSQSQLAKFTHNKENSMNAANHSKIRNKENDFAHANGVLKMNRTASSRDGTKNIKSMSGIRKLYTLKANSSSRRLESQSYRDMGFKTKHAETVKNGKVIQSNSTIYHASLNGKKRHAKVKTSSSETPKLRSNNEGMFSTIKAKINKEQLDKENQKPNNSNNYTSNYDVRMLRKPPNPNMANKQAKSTNMLKKANFGPTTERLNNSVDHRLEAKKQKELEEQENEKKNKVQSQIMGHLNKGELPESPIVTPIMGNDGHIRQYIINDPILNPEDMGNEPPLEPSCQITNTTVDKSKCSTRKNGVVKAYAANTNKGIIRNYNEDRVSIILNILKPNSRKDEQWPKCSFFGVFDGHGGQKCADFLRD